MLTPRSDRDLANLSSLTLVCLIDFSVGKFRLYTTQHPLTRSLHVKEHIKSFGRAYPGVQLTSDVTYD